MGQNRKCRGTLKLLYLLLFVLLKTSTSKVASGELSLLYSLGLQKGLVYPRHYKGNRDRMAMKFR